ncbi:hypothetical protein R6Q57_013472 [Mikania cordata]
MSYDLHPGPIVDDLLFLKDSHRARDIFNNREVPKLVFRRADQKWREKLTYKDVVSHSLRACRSQLHSLREGEMDGISQTYRQAGQFMHTESTLNFQNFVTLQNTANQVMGMLNEESRLHYPSHLHTGPINLGGG